MSARSLRRIVCAGALVRSRKTRWLCNRQLSSLQTRAPIRRPIHPGSLPRRWEGAAVAAAASPGPGWHHPGCGASTAGRLRHLCPCGRPAPGDAAAAAAADLCTRVRPHAASGEAAAAAACRHFLTRPQRSVCWGWGRTRPLLRRRRLSDAAREGTTVPVPACTARSRVRSPAGDAGAPAGQPHAS